MDFASTFEQRTGSKPTADVIRAWFQANGAAPPVELRDPSCTTEQALAAWARVMNVQLTKPSMFAALSAELEKDDEDEIKEVKSISVPPAKQTAQVVPPTKQTAQVRRFRFKKATLKDLRLPWKIRTSVLHSIADARFCCSHKCDAPIRFCSCGPAPSVDQCCECNCSDGKQCEREPEPCFCASAGTDHTDECLEISRHPCLYVHKRGPAHFRDYPKTPYMAIQPLFNEYVAVDS